MVLAVVDAISTIVGEIGTRLATSIRHPRMIRASKFFLVLAIVDAISTIVGETDTRLDTSIRCKPYVSCGTSLT
jgi:dolichol kinase